MRTILSALFFVCAAASAQDVSYPTVEASYRARGSINVQHDGPFTKTNVQMNFEENFQLSPNRVALNLDWNGDNRTIIEHIQERQAFIYSRTGCKPVPEGDYKLEAGMKLLKAELNDQYIYPIRQLLNLSVEHLVSKIPEKLFWDKIPVHKWTFYFNDTTTKITIQANWKISNSIIPSKRLREPVSFIITRSLYNADLKEWHDIKQSVDIKSFTHGEVNSHVFRPRRGMFCPGRRDPNHFPEQVAEKLKNLHTEVKKVVKKYSETGVIHTWHDRRNKTYEVNYAPFVNKIKNGVQRIVSKVQGVVYEIKESRECAVKAVKDFKDQFDPETIFNPMEKNFNMESFFGTDHVNYVSIGETVERGVPCVLYQGQRTDWPQNIEKPITTVWEWCLANEAVSEVKFQLNGYPIVNLNIYVTKSPFDISQSVYVEGLRLNYNFNEFRNRTHEYLDNLATDIRECFSDANQKILSFRAAVKDKVKELISKNTHRLEHEAAWRAAICKAASINPGSLRISNVETRLNQGDLEVSFTVLGPHPNLPNISAEVSLDTAVANVKTTLDNGQLGVDVKLGTETKEEVVNLKGNPGTLQAKQVVVGPVGGDSKTSAVAITIGAVAVVIVALGSVVGAAVYFAKRRRHEQYERLLT